MLVAIVALAVAILTASFTGATDPILAADAGAVVRWALPPATLLTHLGSALTVGLLLVAAFLTPERGTTDRRRTACRYAVVAATLWAASAAAVTVLTFADLAGLSLSEPALWAQLGDYLFSLEVTRILALQVIAATVVAVIAALARGQAAMAWGALVALVGILLGALTSHSGGSAAHEDVVNSMGVHLLGVAVWVGGLAALALMWRTLGRDLSVTVGRYSVLAGWAYALVAISGVQQAILRVGSWSAVTSAYGLLVAGKAILLVLLGLLGWQQRRRIVARVAEWPERTRAAFARLAIVELVLMGSATGMGAALSRSQPPVPDSLPQPSTVLTLTGYPDPGPMLAGDWFTAWRINWLFLGIAILAVGLYVAGVIRLRRRGDAWPWWRTALWVAGWLVWVYFTCGAPDIWGRVLFSTHMLMHMGVAMIMPLLLVPAAPITLTLRALPARTDKTWGPRELVLHLVHSRALKLLANPIVAATLFFVSLAIFYWSPAFELALTTHTGHLLMLAHFVLTGYLFVWVLIGTDPGPPRWSPLMLLVLLFATISFHAFFGVALTDSRTLLAPGFFERINLPWGPDPLADQHTAGMIAWGIGEVPTLVLAVLVAARWVTIDRIESKRQDRKADRDGDADLAAYNAYLASLRGRGED